MSPQAFKKFISDMWEYTKIFNDDLIMPIWHWFDNKKTILGASFFFLKEWVIMPYYEKVLHTAIPDRLDFSLATIAAIFTVLGVTHKSIRYISDKRNGGTHAAKAIAKSDLD